MFLEEENYLEISENYIDFLILGSYKNEPLLEEFLEHLFYEKKIKNEEVFNIDFFNKNIDNNYIDVILPLSSLPKNFYNDNNTFLNKKEKFFQINITFPNDNNLLPELNNFLKSFSQLLKNNSLISFIRNSNDTLPNIKRISNNLIENVDMDNLIELNNNNKIIEKINNNFKFNSF